MKTDSVLRMHRLVGNILDTDSYKFSHWLQDPPGTTNSGFYLSSRGGKFANTIFFGLQRFCKEELAEPVTLEQIDYASANLPKHGTPFNREGWLRVLEKHRGYLPIRIRAVREGTVVPSGNVLLDVRSTDPDLPWVSGYVETQMVRGWAPITISTKSYYGKKIIFKHLLRSSDDPLGELPFKLHDFGGRGVTSRQHAGIGGMAHLVNFMGTDTYMGVLYAEGYYGEPMAGFSVPAAEHSTACKWGKARHGEFYRHMFKAFGKKGCVWACVSDTYDYYDTVENEWGGSLGREIAESGSTVVCRPDSGVPVDVVLKTLEILDRKVGTVKNKKGYKVLPPWIRIIQGDGVGLDPIDEIYEAIEARGFSSTNVGFGMGGELQQKGIDRDTNKFAYKCWDATIDGEVHEIFKDPATDPGKRSLAGQHSLILERGQFSTVKGELPGNLLEPVWDTGDVLRDQSFSEVRKLAGAEFTL